MPASDAGRHQRCFWFRQNYVRGRDRDRCCSAAGGDQLAGEEGNEGLATRACSNARGTGGLELDCLARKPCQNMRSAQRQWAPPSRQMRRVASASRWVDNMRLLVAKCADMWLLMLWLQGAHAPWPVAARLVATGTGALAIGLPWLPAVLRLHCLLLLYWQVKHIIRQSSSRVFQLLCNAVHARRRLGVRATAWWCCDDWRRWLLLQRLAEVPSWH